MTEGEAEISKVKLLSPDKKGVEATCDISKDDTIMFIPRKLLITYEQVKLTKVNERVTNYRSDSIIVKRLH